MNPFEFAGYVFVSALAMGGGIVMFTIGFNILYKMILK